MKKQFLLFLSAFCISVSSLFAQDARTGLTPADRTKATMEKLAPFDLAPEVRKSTEAIFTDFYTSQQTSMQEARTAGTDRATMMETRKKIVADRDAKLKQVLTEEQYNKWVSDIEPALKAEKARAKSAPVTAPLQ